MDADRLWAPANSRAGPNCQWSRQLSAFWTYCILHVNHKDFFLYYDLRVLQAPRSVPNVVVFWSRVKVPNSYAITWYPPMKGGPWNGVVAKRFGEDDVALRLNGSAGVSILDHYSREPTNCLYQEFQIYLNVVSATCHRWVWLAIIGKDNLRLWLPAGWKMIMRCYGDIYFVFQCGATLTRLFLRTRE